MNETPSFALPQPVDATNSEHYIWGEVSEGWRLLAHPELSVIRERVPPGAGESRHYHSRARQFFFVLSGRAQLEFDGGKVAFGAGQGLEVAPGLPHRFANAGPEDVVFLVISSPTTIGDRTSVPD